MPIYCSSTLRMTPTDSTGSFPADTEGAIYYDDSEAQLKHYDGGNWLRVSKDDNYDRPGDGQYTVDAYTKLLIHSNTSNNSTTFADSSLGSHIITATNANHSTTQAKIGGSSMHFDGTGQQLSIADSADFYYGTGDFTVDFWVYPETVNRRTTLYTQMESGTDSSQRIDIKDVSGYKYRTWFNSASGQTPVSEGNIGSVVTGAWAHIAFVRNGNIFKGYLNGAEGFSQTSAAGHWDIGEPLLIMNSTDNLYANGIYMDEFRISKGIARWTSNFTVYS